MTVPDGWSAKPVDIVRYPSGNIDYLAIRGTAPETETGEQYCVQVLKPSGDGTSQILVEFEVFIDLGGHFHGREGWPLGKEAPAVADYTYEIHAIPGSLYDPTGQPFQIGTGTTNVQL